MTAPRILPVLALLLLPTLVSAQDVAARRPIYRYEEKKFEGGELKYHGKIPVLTVSGTPDEIGKQIGQLNSVVLKDVQDLIEGYVRFRGWQGIYPWILKTGSLLEWNFPASHRRECDSAIKTAKVDRDLIVFMNTVFDVVGGLGCSAIVAEPTRSTTGEMMFGRNLDLPPFAHLHELTLVTVYHPKGKRSFASIGFPGVFGVISGMNDAGLALAVNEIVHAKDDGLKLNPLGTPKLMLLRRVLEECATVDEAEKLIRDTSRTGMMAVTICDAKSAAVLEVTSKNVVRRTAADGLCTCTNHFCTKELSVGETCVRKYHLDLGQKRPKLSADDIADRLHAARFGDLTMQTMIFEPARLRLELGFGRLPSSSQPRQSLDLGPLLRRE